MDQLTFDGHFLKSNVICCESLLKLKYYVNMLQVESYRLSSLQLECNQLLDQFYVLKDEFEFLVNEALAMKYVAANIHSFDEYIYDFTLFVRKIWQVGKYQFSEKGKKSQYVCIIGSLLSDVISTVESFVEVLQNSLMHGPSHSDCAIAIQSITSQIYTEMQDSLGSAAACLKQYVYLKLANPFLQELNGLIQHYLVLPEIHTVKQFVDKVILNIPSTDLDSAKENSEEMVSFQFVVDLLNGKLFDKDVLDHNSDIRPIAEDDINLKNIRLVFKTTEWIMAQYKVTDVQDILMNSMSSIVPFESIDRSNVGPTKTCTYGKPISTQSPTMFNYSAGEVVDQFDLNLKESMNKRDSPKVHRSPIYTQRKYSPRRSHKHGSKNVEVNASDLQPIDIQLLQTPLPFPLL